MKVRVNEYAKSTYAGMSGELIKNFSISIGLNGRRHINRNVKCLRFDHGIMANKNIWFLDRELDL